MDLSLFLPKAEALEASSRENFKALAESQRKALPAAARVLAIQFYKGESKDDSKWLIVCESKQKSHIQTIPNLDVLSALLGGLNVEGLKEMISSFGGGQVEESPEEMATLINNFLAEKIKPPYDSFLYSLQADGYFLVNLEGVKTGIVSDPMPTKFTDFVNLAEILQELTKEK